MRSVRRVHKELIVCSVGSQLLHLGSCSEMGDSQLRRETVNTEVELPTALEAVTRRLVQTQQTEKI
jgi:hypothetical protein